MDGSTVSTTFDLHWKSMEKSLKLPNVWVRNRSRTVISRYCK